MWTWLLMPALLLRFMLRRLPAPLLNRLDTWSHRRAQRRWARRRAKAASPGPASTHP